MSNDYSVFKFPSRIRISEKDYFVFSSLRQAENSIYNTGFSTSFNPIRIKPDIRGEENTVNYFFSSYVLNNSERKTLFVVHDPFLELLFYGNLYSLNDGIINSGFELFFPEYFNGSLNEEQEKVKKNFNKNIVEVNNDFGLDGLVEEHSGRGFSNESIVFKFEYGSLDQEVFRSIFRHLILGNNIEGSVFSYPSIFDFSTVNFNNDFFGILRYYDVKSIRGEYFNVVGLQNSSFEKFVFLRKPGSITVLKK